MDPRGTNGFKQRGITRHHNHRAARSVSLTKKRRESPLLSLCPHTPTKRNNAVICLDSSKASRPPVHRSNEINDNLTKGWIKDPSAFFHVPCGHWFTKPKPHTCRIAEHTNRGKR
jgi:hypothetical protein